ncbi:hypothetical protein ACNJYG_06685 [Pseudomonas sp. GW6]
MQNPTHYEVTLMDGEPILKVAVEIEGGILCTGMRLDAHEPGTTGALVGYVANSLVLNAPQFPGSGATEPAAASRSVQVGSNSIEVLTVEFIAEQGDE